MIWYNHLKKFYDLVQSHANMKCVTNLSNRKLFTFLTDKIFPILKSSLAGVISRCSVAPFGCSEMKNKKVGDTIILITDDENNIKY